MENDQDEMLEICDALEEYAELEGSELGEACNLLITLTNFDYCFSESFNNSLVEEIKQQLQNFKDNSKITKKEVTRSYEVEQLEWITNANEKGE